MRAVVQRVRSAGVSVDGELIGAISRGMVVFLGVESGDGPQECAYMAEKVANLRIFEDDRGLMNLSVKETGGAVLCVSQFTLLGDCRKGRRPSFVKAAPPEEAARLYEGFCSALRGQGLAVATGRFQACMLVSIENDGPVTILLDSNRAF